MSSDSVTNRLPNPWRLEEEEFPDKGGFFEDRWFGARMSEHCGITFDLQPATMLTSLNWDNYAKSYVELVGRIHSDLRLERMAAELMVLAERVRELESQSAKLDKAESPLVELLLGYSPIEQTPVKGEASGRGNIKNIEFRSTEQFEQDLERLPSAERVQVVHTINSNSQLLIKGPLVAKNRGFVRPYKILLKGGLESSLSEARVGKDLRVLLTIDDDPIFGQVILTLLRVVRRREMRQAFDQVVQLLYPDQVLGIQPPGK